MMVDLKKALSEGTATAGGYIVPEEFSKEIIKKVVEQSYAMQLNQTVRMKYDTFNVPSATGGSTAYWIAENATITTADMAFGTVQLLTKKVGAIMQLSSELLDDSDPAVAEIVLDQMSRDIAFKVDSAVFGALTTPFYGFRNWTGVGTVAASTNGDTITLDKISDAVYAIQTALFKADTIMMHPRTLNELRKLKESTSSNNPLLNEINFGSPIAKTGVVGTIYGLNVVPSTVVPITITQGSATTATELIVFDSKNAGLVGMRRDMTFNKDYSILLDAWYLQANMRMAFAMKNPTAVCIIKGIIS